MDIIDGFGVGVFAFLALAIATVIAGAKVVPQGYNWTVQRFGRYTKTLKPGLNIIFPYIDTIGEKVNMMEGNDHVHPVRVAQQTIDFTNQGRRCVIGAQRAIQRGFVHNQMTRSRRKVDFLLGKVGGW